MVQIAVKVREFVGRLWRGSYALVAIGKRRCSRGSKELISYAGVRSLVYMNGRPKCLETSRGV